MGKDSTVRTDKPEHSPLPSRYAKYEGHTPGPWTMETLRTSCGICHKIGPFPGHGTWEVGNACIYVDYPGTGPREVELETNARLITDAPTLLAENKRLRVALESIAGDATENFNAAAEFERADDMEKWKSIAEQASAARQGDTP